MVRVFCQNYNSGHLHNGSQRTYFRGGKSARGSYNRGRSNNSGGRRAGAADEDAIFSNLAPITAAAQSTPTLAQSTAQSPLTPVAVQSTATNVHTMVTHAKSGIHKPRHPLCLHVKSSSTSSLLNSEPKSVLEAMQSPP
ncbi:hypothetical protein U1Q18_048349 [Sarracenia purpurea var. burkii]